jgi:hypothetical protein
MEIIAESGVGGYGPCNISKKVKGETAAFGFRVKIPVDIDRAAYRCN